jgi:RNA polymerase sigma factor (sigma-70 family)
MASSFIDELINANMARINHQLQDVDTFLESLRPEIRAIAYTLDRPRSVDIEDLVQVGMIAAWKAYEAQDMRNATSPRSYFTCAAKWRMRDYLRTERKHDADSLDTWFIGRGDNREEKARDVADYAPYRTPRGEHLAKRRLMWSILRQLPSKHQAILVAEYLGGMNYEGHHVTREGISHRYTLTEGQYRRAKKTALSMVRRMASRRSGPEGVQS